MGNEEEQFVESQFFVGQEVQAQWEGEYFPATVSAISDHIISVKFMDYDQDADLTLDQIRPLDIEYFEDIGEDKKAKETEMTEKEKKELKDREKKKRAEKEEQEKKEKEEREK